MKYQYAKTFSPPAPILPIELLVADDSRRRAQVEAKLDTAADISAIPAAVVEGWDLEPVSEVVVTGYNTEAAILATYAVGIELPEARIRHIEVIVIPNSYALLGRDVLNHFYVNLDGPDLTFEIALTRRVGP
jgi:hypothetical protein